jgi:23S rRNA (uracil1939-C5)-methyltransferase
MAGIQEGQVVYDLYCGVGSIGIYLAEQAKKIVGIELVEEAIVDARMNAKINGMENCEYFAADIREIFLNQTLLLKLVSQILLSQIHLEQVCTPT